MICFFCGGPLDGELREVRIPPRMEGQVVYQKSIATDMAGYHIANGIARHESVSEEEVARMVGQWRRRLAMLESVVGNLPLE